MFLILHLNIIFGKHIGTNTDTTYVKKETAFNLNSKLKICPYVMENEVMHFSKVLF